jgi:hypothetical protein
MFNLEIMRNPWNWVIVFGISVIALALVSVLAPPNASAS